MNHHDQGDDSDVDAILERLDSAPVSPESGIAADEVFAAAPGTGGPQPADYPAAPAVEYPVAGGPVAVYPPVPEADPDLGMEAVVNSRKGERRWADKPAMIMLGTAGLVAVAIAVTIGVFLSGGSGGDGDDPAMAGAEDTTRTAPDTAPPTTSAPEEPAFAAPTDPTFSWWGDGLSVIASQYEPIIGARGHDYYWNASNSVSIDDAIDALATTDDERVGGLVVWAFGNSSEVTESHISRLQQAIGGDRALVLVGVGTNDPSVNPWADAVNERYAALAAGRPGTYFVDWQDYLIDNPKFVRDGFVLTREGTAAWANAINYTILEAYGGD